MDNKPLTILQMGEKELRQIIRSEIQSLKIERPVEPKEKYLTKTDVAKRFQVSLPTVNNWQAQKKIIPRKVGRRCYYLESDIQKLINN